MPGGDEGQFKDKLIRTKEQWARDGRGLTGEAGDPKRRRLPPGQHLVRDWPVLDLGMQPNKVPEEWSLTTAGAVNGPLRWDWETFLAQPQSEVRCDIHCVTTWSRYDNTFTGVSARHFLKEARPRAETEFLMIRSYDGYSTNVPLSWFDDDDVLLAHSWNGAPLSREHGGPVRLVIPKLYFWKSAKWLRHITFLEKDQPGYWEARGYHSIGDPWKEQRYG